MPKDKPFDFHKVAKPYFVVPWHFHPEIEIMLITKGKGTRFIGDSIEHFEPYDLVMVGPNLAHVWKNNHHLEAGNNQTAECIYILFTENSFGPDFFKIPEMVPLRNLLTKSNRGIKFFGETKLSVAEKILKAHQQTGVPQFITFMEILHALSGSDEYELLSSIGFNGKIQASDLHRLNDVLDYLMKNFKAEVRLEEIAEIANMSSTSFCRYFKSRTNKTVFEFINEIRIGHAHKLLIETPYNMDQICFESGFKNVSSFFKQFKTVTGKTPSKFRQDHNERIF